MLKKLFVGVVGATLLCAKSVCFGLGSQSVTIMTPSNLTRMSQVVQPGSLPTSGLKDVNSNSIDIRTMSGMTAFIANPIYSCGYSSPPPNPCYVALTASTGTTTVNTLPLCPSGYSLLFQTGTTIKDSDGKTLNYDSAFTQQNVSENQYNFYSGITGFSCSTMDSNTTYTAVGTNAVQGNAGGSSCGLFCVNSSNKPNPSEVKFGDKTYKVGDSLNYNGQFVKINSITNNGYTCYTAGHVWAPNSSCSWVAGAYWETYPKATLNPYQCSRAGGFYNDGAIHNPNGYPMPSRSVSPYASPTVSICGKMVGSSNWQSVP